MRARAARAPRDSKPDVLKRHSFAVLLPSWSTGASATARYQKFARYFGKRDPERCILVEGGTMRRRDLLAGAGSLGAGATFNFPGPAVAQKTRRLKMVTDWPAASP